MKSMKAVMTEVPGGPENLLIKSMPLPKPAADEVLIQVYAMGVNPADVEQRKGEYLPPPGSSAVLGLEVAGIIIEIGENVTEYKVGDRVMALLTCGGYAEYALAHSSLCLSIPSHFNFVEAATIPEAVFTVWSTIFYGTKLKKGETFLVHGGTGGIGSFAIQLVKFFEAKVITTAGSADKCKLCYELGADLAINYQTESFYECALKFTQNKGVDVILDCIGGDYLIDHLRLLAKNGRLVLIDCVGNSNTEIDLIPLIIKNLSVSGAVLRPRLLSEKIAIANEIKKLVMPYLNAKKIKPLISKTFPLEKVLDAHVFMESKKHVGKIVLINEWEK